MGGLYAAEGDEQAAHDGGEEGARDDRGLRAWDGGESAASEAGSNSMLYKHMPYTGSVWSLLQESVRSSAPPEAPSAARSRAFASSRLLPSWAPWAPWAPFMVALPTPSSPYVPTPPFLMWLSSPTARHLTTCILQL